ncbi:NADPH:quinone reductase [Asanoa siamensis]|uniref:NADPH:quinone reductase n=1 Tax=Asanoa siamensis TaxID=926357 RepID=A0ABQ4CJ96_9ACTN|nr:NADPH:quinone reductase [Asanoa siamensis]
MYDAYGPPETLRVEEVARPVPRGDEVLVKVHAVGVNASDWETQVGTPLYARIGGLRRPRHRTLGSDIAGVVEAIGPAVTRVRVGEEVFGDNLERMGGFAEYVVAREKVLAPKHPGLSFAQAAALPQSGVIALQGIRGPHPVGPGHRVLVNGAGGGTGALAIQLAKLDGAEVTGVDNTAKQEFMRTAGADHVIDYTRTDFTRLGERWDLVLDLSGHHGALAHRRALTPKGRYRWVGGSMNTMLQVLVGGALLGRQRILVVRPNTADLLTMADLCASGTLTTHIERHYRLDEVPAALRHLGDGRALGKLVVTVA